MCVGDESGQDEMMGCLTCIVGWLNVWKVIIEVGYAARLV